jgi:hypothetical protein
VRERWSRATLCVRVAGTPIDVLVFHRSVVSSTWQNHGAVLLDVLHPALASVVTDADSFASSNYIFDLLGNGTSSSLGQMNVSWILER